MLIVGNPYSGRGAGRNRAEALTAALQAHDLAPRIIWEPEARRAALADPKLTRRCRCIVSAGGDGSLADVINDLAQGQHLHKIPVAMLPVGNENLFARELGFNTTCENLATAIARGQTLRIDLGAANGRLFTLMLSAGFDSAVVQRVDAWRHRADGGLRCVSRISYAPRIAGAVFGYDYPPVTLEADDGTTVRGAHVFVFNLAQYGMGLGIAPNADGSDGVLDWVVLQRPGTRMLMTYALSVLTGRHLRRNDVQHGRAKRLRLTADSAVPLQADGDPAGATPMDVEVHPQALTVLNMGNERSRSSAQ